MILFLTGFMGSGKSTLGKGVAASMKLPFIDLDREMELATGMNISEIFSEKGEEWFRERESSVLGEITTRYSSAVVATGGGTPCHSDNMQFMLGSGVVLYLRMSAAAIVSRLKGNGKQSRPLLASLPEDGLLSFAEKKLEEREPFYIMAHVVADALNATPVKIKELLMDEGYL